MLRFLKLLSTHLTHSCSTLSVFGQLESCTVTIIYSITSVYPKSDLNTWEMWSNTKSHRFTDDAIPTCDRTLRSSSPQTKPGGDNAPFLEELRHNWVSTVVLSAAASVCSGEQLIVSLTSFPLLSFTCGRSLPPLHEALKNSQKEDLKLFQETNWIQIDPMTIDHFNPCRQRRTFRDTLC